MKIKLLSRANSAWFLLVGAIALAALMSFAVLRYLQERERSLQAEVVAKAQGGPKVDVVVPMRDVPAGTPVSRDVFVSRPIDADLVYPDMVTPDMFDQFTNRSTIAPILQGRPLRIGDMETTERPLAASIPRGFRAITIGIDSTNSLSNMIRPGDLVDLYLLATPSNDTGGAAKAATSGDVASLLLQKMPVLATGKHVYDKDERPIVRAPDGSPPPAVAEYDTLTLQASPDESARIALAQKVGSIRAVLRGGKDGDTIPPSILATGQLFPSDDPSAQRVRSVQYIVGGQGDAAVTQRSLPDLVGAMAASRIGQAVAAKTAAPAAAAAPAPAAAPSTMYLVPPNAKAPSDASSPSVFFPQAGGTTRR